MKYIYLDTLCIAGENAVQIVETSKTQLPFLPNIGSCYKQLLKKTSTLFKTALVQIDNSSATISCCALDSRTPQVPISPLSSVDVIQHRTIAVNFQQIFKFTVYKNSEVDSRVLAKPNHNLDFACLGWVQHRTAQGFTGCIVKYKQNATLASSPVLCSYHVAFSFGQTFCGL